MSGVKLFFMMTPGKLYGVPFGAGSVGKVQSPVRFIVVELRPGATRRFDELSDSSRLLLPASSTTTNNGECGPAEAGRYVRLTA
jgi:hypothetical protein